MKEYSNDAEKCSCINSETYTCADNILQSIPIDLHVIHKRYIVNPKVWIIFGDSTLSFNYFLFLISEQKTASDPINA